MAQDDPMVIDLANYPNADEVSPISPNPWPSYRCRLDPGTALDMTINGSNGTATLTYTFTNLPTGVASAWVTQFVFKKTTDTVWTVADTNAGGGAEFWIKVDQANSTPNSRAIEWVKDKADSAQDYNYVLYVDLRDANDAVIATFAIDPMIHNQ